MRNLNSTNLALYYSVTTIGIVLITIAITDFIFNLSANWEYIFLFVAISFIISFFTLRFLVFKYLYNRIKLIYKTINKKKGGKHILQKDFNYSKDMIQEIEKDVNTWADEQSKEIEKLVEMGNFRKEFMGNIAHELKTPIFNIQGYTLTLLEGGLEDSTINAKYLQKIEKNINRMISLVTDLDAIMRLESGVLKPRIVDFNPIILCNETIENLEDFAKEKQITISIKKHYEGVKKVLADKEFIKQVFSNLLINAIHYNKEKGKVVIEFFIMDNNMLIEVTDNGIGIPEEDLPRVFERFYRVDKSRSLNSGGSGLGLAIVKHIIESHKQTLNVRSTVGVGTTIAFTLKLGK
jgi:two-component system, OmpR family, phosphate regulon sensor histidine kinase PhoR